MILEPLRARSPWVLISCVGPLLCSVWGQDKAAVTRAAPAGCFPGYTSHPCKQSSLLHFFILKKGGQGIHVRFPWGMSL